MSVAVVTGSSSGIGRATAIELSAKGYDLVLHGFRNLSGLQETAREIRSKRPNAKLLLVTADISQPAACHELVTASYGWSESIDAWVNIAGADILTGYAAEKDFESKLEQLLAVDVQGTIRICRLVAEQIRANASQENRPCLINIGWDQATTGMEGEPGQLFCPTKAAIHAFTRSLALDLGKLARINLIAPGWIQTRWGAEHIESYWGQRACRESLSARWGSVQDVAEAISWICSDQAAFINSQVIEVNGGLKAHQDR